MLLNKNFLMPSVQCKRLKPEDSSVIFHHISILESIEIPKDSQSKGYSDFEKGKWEQSKLKQNKKYILLFQGNVKGAKKDIKTIAFGPFAGQIADWKMYLLSKRIGDIPYSLLYRSESVVVCSRDQKTFHFKSSSPRSKVPTFGFILLGEEDLPDDDNRV